MASEKDTALGRLAVERGYVTQEQLDEALDHQRKMHDEFGMDQPLEQVLVGKHLVSQDQAQELRHAVAIQTGEARLVAGYEVISKLGQGGMGAVYKAKHPTSGQFVALKILPPSLATPELVKRFRREAEIVRKLDHANIVACTEFGFDKRRKVHFCALELVEGEDLAKRITRVGRLTEDEALSITNQVAMALQHAFYNGLVHRDVKPENIMVTADGTAKLLDLGLARPANQEATRLTESGMFVGSPYYASPEQALGQREVDTRSDIYSLGATLYHMVTGKPPFEGTTALAILQKHVNEKLPWPGDVNPDLSDGLCLIIAKMMEKSPEDRYETPNDLNRDLDLLMEGEEPEVEDAALKNSSVKVPAVRPGRRRRHPAARARHGKHLDRGRRDSAREHRRALGREGRARPSGRSALPMGAKIAVGAGVLGLVVMALVMSLGEGEEERLSEEGPKDTLRAKPGKVTPEIPSSDTGAPAVDTRKVSPPSRVSPETHRRAPVKKEDVAAHGALRRPESTTGRAGVMKPAKTAPRAVTGQPVAASAKPADSTGAGRGLPSRPDRGGEPAQPRSETGRKEGEAPRVVVISPTAGTAVKEGQPVPLRALVSDSDDDVERVEYLVNGEKVAETTDAPFWGTWSGGKAGDYSRVAKAYDRAGNITTTPPLPVRVLAPADQGPGVVIRESGPLLDLKPIRVIKAHGKPVASLCFLPDGKALFSASYGDGSGGVKLWDCQTGSMVATFPARRQVTAMQ
ncbi:MAG: protein kinase domain-containing protein, partial [Planctomycetota bacterium]